MPEEQQVTDSPKRVPNSATPNLPSTGSPHESREADFWEAIKILLRTNKWPAWLLVAFAPFSIIPDWNSRISFWFDALSAVGGSARMIADILPFIGLASGVLGTLYFFVIVWNEDIEPARRWLPLAGWTLVVVFVMIFGATGLFAEFIATSKIPDMVEFYNQQHTQRILTIQQFNILKDKLKNTKQDIVPFSLEAGRDPEDLEYASTILNALKEIGLKITKDGQDQNTPLPTDLFSPSWRGILLAVKYPDAPPRSAVLLKQALDDAQIPAQFIRTSDENDNAFFVVVGLK